MRETFDRPHAATRLGVPPASMRSRNLQDSFVLATNINPSNGLIPRRLKVVGRPNNPVLYPKTR